MLKNLHTLWQFSRPHTIIGSVVSITTLWLLAFRGYALKPHLQVLLFTLVAGIACNIFIVGLNQIIDVDLDKINKPKLPIAAGALSLRTAKQIILICALLSIGLAFYTSIILGILISVIFLIGIAYSLPPIQLKKHHLPAAIAITLVRGILVNLGMFAHFRFVIGEMPLQVFLSNFQSYFPVEIWVLTSFVVAFSIAIAWFKDLPDTKGDAEFQFKTLAVLYSTRFAFFAGLSMVALAYLYALIWSFMAHEWWLFTCHLVASMLFLINATFVRLNQPSTITRFYLIFWVFFFVEYLFFAVWSFLG